MKFFIKQLYVAFTHTCALQVFVFLVHSTFHLFLFQILYHWPKNTFVLFKLMWFTNMCIVSFHFFGSFNISFVFVVVLHVASLLFFKYFTIDLTTPLCCSSSCDSHLKMTITDTTITHCLHHHLHQHNCLHHHLHHR